MKLEQFVGQNNVKHILSVLVESARVSGRPVGHILLYGPPGVGKTTLAGIVADEIGDGKVLEFSGATATKQKLLSALLVSKPSVIIVDEIHRLDVETAEMLYPAMDEYTIVVASAVPVRVAPFTFIGTTTDPARIPRPMMSRFQVQLYLDFYTNDELAQIVLAAAADHGIVLDWESAQEIGRRSRGTPRVAKQLLSMVASFATASHIDAPSRDDVVRWLRMVVDDLGLSALERKYLLTLTSLFGGGPVGLSTLANALGESPRTVADAERYLQRLGLIRITSSGREITEIGLVRIVDIGNATKE